MENDHIVRIQKGCSQMKQISVIIACYNAVDYLERCVKSLRDQTIGFDSLEVIFVDDNSTDNTWDKLLELEKKYPDQYRLSSHTMHNQGLCYMPFPVFR